MINYISKLRDRKKQTQVDLNTVAISELGSSIIRLEQRIDGLLLSMANIEARLPPANLAGDQLNVRFDMTDIRVAHLERLIGLQDPGSEDNNTQLTELLDNRLRWLEMRLMSYLEGPYLARLGGAASLPNAKDKT